MDRELRRADGTERVMHPRHLIFATGVSSIPITPNLPGLADFAGTIVHSGAFGMTNTGVAAGPGARHRHQRP